MSELWVALVGAIVGGSLTVMGAVLQSRLLARLQVIRAREQARVDLVREIVRHRMDALKRHEPLNEVPLLFGDDTEALRLYRSLAGSGLSEAERTGVFRDLIVHLAKLTGMPTAAAGDIARGIPPDPVASASLDWADTP